MIESPIKRKHFPYPKDFTKNSQHPSKEVRPKYKFVQECSIETSPTKNQSDFHEQIQQKQSQQKDMSKELFQINPEKITITNSQVEQQSPLNHHFKKDRPTISEEMLRNPRFAVADREISEVNDFNIEASASPGTIKKQLDRKQVPLPLQDPCHIDLFKAGKPSVANFRENIIKFSASGNFGSKKWTSSEQDVIEKYNEDKERNLNLNLEEREKNKSMRQLPIIAKNEEKAHFKQQFQNLRKKQQSFSEGFGKMNNLLFNLKHRDNASTEHKNGNNEGQNPVFEPRTVRRLKQQISEITEKNKFRRSDIFDSQDDEPNENHENQENEDDHQTSHFRYSERQYHLTKKNKNLHRNQIIISYRTSLSTLKRLSQQRDIDYSFLIIRIPKLFAEGLIYKDQPKSELYTMAKGIFSELKIPHQHLIIKRYSNCTLMVSKNICLIWHFSGKRYLGGWQTEYLDEGFKHGLGLEYEPNQYVYYGEFVKNKKEGLGLYKDCNQEVYLGFWSKGYKSFSYEEKSDAKYKQRKSNFAEFTNQYEPDSNMIEFD